MKKTHRKQSPASKDEYGLRAGVPPRHAPPRRGAPGMWKYAAPALVVLLAVGLVGYGTYLMEPWASDPPKKQEDKAEAGPPKLNPASAPGPAPKDMVWVRGGEFHMGDDERFPDAAPVHKVYVDAFWMDRTEVTNAMFAEFVKATGYVTVAERRPDPKLFPQLRPDRLLRQAIDEENFKAADYLLGGYPTTFLAVLTTAPAGGLPGAVPWGPTATLYPIVEPVSLVFEPHPLTASLRDHTKWWMLVKGACWKHPEGPSSHVRGRTDHPVVHICWDDAVAYCKWRSTRDKATVRLPTEAEWEFAARGGLDRTTYYWGDELLPGKKWQANIWQGRFPIHNTNEDTFYRTAPVASFPANGYGLHDMSGNVWEWCADWYQPDYYERSPKNNPTGPSAGFDPQEPGIAKRVQRGGSFLCCDNYCVRYMAGARGKGDPTSGASHVGFRCVREAPRATSATLQRTAP